MNCFENFDLIYLQNKIDASCSISELFKVLGISDKGGNRKTFYGFCRKNSINLNKLIENRNNKIKNGCFSANKINDGDIFIENSKVRRATVKSRVLKNKLISYCCSLCGNNGNWNNKNLTLQLEHKNGIENDNRLENLCFLCPNCHSQTDTFAGKNISAKNKNIFKNEEIKKYFINKEEYNKSFVITNNNNSSLIDERRKSIEKYNLNKFGWVKELSKEWNVSHSQVKRWIKKYYPEITFFERKSFF